MNKIKKLTLAALAASLLTGMPWIHAAENLGNQAMEQYQAPEVAEVPEVHEWQLENVAFDDGVLPPLNLHVVAEHRQPKALKKAKSKENDRHE